MRGEEVAMDRPEEREKRRPDGRRTGKDEGGGRRAGGKILYRTFFTIKTNHERQRTQRKSVVKKCSP